MAYTPTYYQPYDNGGYIPPAAQMQQMRTQQYQPPRAPGFANVPITGAPAQQPQEAQQPIIWVQGIEGAKGYFVLPNSTVQLWDAERQTIYLKSADASGVPSIRILDWVERTMPTGTQQQGGVEYATKQEVEELKGLLHSFLNPPKNKRTVKEDSDNV